jgi:predicted dehydrogenase
VRDPIPAPGDPATPLRVAVIGAGAFGRNHLRVYRELETAHPDLLQLAALVEPDPTRRADLAAAYNIPAFATVADLLAAPHQHAGAPPQTSGAPPPHAGAPFTTASSSWVGSHNSHGETAPIHAASICVPTVHHAAVAEQLLLAGPDNCGIDILIEKPFAATLAEADRILSLARAHHRIVAIGHLERFNPAVTAALAALNQPMFFEAHRLSIFTPRSLDVDVVLDLMIHDLDIVLALTNSPVKEVRAVGLPILSGKVDIANVRIEFVSGCVANFTASRVSTEQVRKLRLFQPHQYLSLDFARQELLTISVDPTLIAATLQHPTHRPDAYLSTRPTKTLSSRPESSQLHREHAAERPAAPPVAPLSPAGPNQESPPGQADHPTPQHPSAGLSLTKADIPKAEPLRLELEDFLHAVRTRTQPRVPSEAGRAALSLALEINAQIAAHAHRAGLA